VRREADQSVTVSHVVNNRAGRPRWAVTATFVGTGTAEPRCVEYRVRVVPEFDIPKGAAWLANRIVRELQKDQAREDRVPEWALAELNPPAEGIPLRVFEEASQARLLVKAREMVRAHPDFYRDKVGMVQLLDRQRERKVGRPPARSLTERLAILQTAERVFAGGGQIDDVASAHNMSRSAIRDLLAWARHDASPALFTSSGPSRRGGGLTDAARRLLDGVK